MTVDSADGDQMKNIKAKAISCVIIVCLITGCEREETGGFTPMENGFGFAQHSKKTSPMHRAIWADFEYRDTNGIATVVWPYIHSVESIQISSNTVVLLGRKAKPFGDGIERLTTRLVAFEAPTGPPMDITDQVLENWCGKNGVQVTNIIQDSFVGLIKTNNVLRFDFGIIKRGLRGPDTIDAADGTAMISWSEVAEIIQDVKKTGKLKKEKWSGVEYLQKD